MKITYRIPTEMYAYVELQYEYNDTVSAETVAENYSELSKAFKPKPINSLSDKEFNQFIDNMLLGEDNHIESYEKLSPSQKDTVQTIKRALKRLKSKEDTLHNIN